MRRRVPATLPMRLLTALRSSRGVAMQARGSGLRAAVHTVSSSAVEAESWATIEDLQPLSPTTRLLRLRVESPGSFSFAPGQWVDFTIPGTRHIGGYSITSLPSALPLLDLAVKASAHPPAAWCTTRAQPGDRVHLRVGGSFALREAEAALFVAGGVGINPLYCMLRHLLCASKPLAGGRAALLYTAQSRDELLFVSEVHALAQAHPDRLRVWLRSTREPGRPLAVVDAAPGIVGYQSGRANEAMLEQALQWLGCQPNTTRHGRGVPWRAESTAREPGTATFTTPATGAYVCGPPRMTDEMVASLKLMGVPHVYSEQWW